LFSALKLGETDWAADFIETFKTRIFGISPEFTALIIEIAYAALAFARGQYAAAAQLLPHYLTYGAAEDVYSYAIAATLDVRIHFELNDLDEDYGHAMMHATTTRLRRDDTMPAHRKEERLRFFSIAKELYKLKELRQFDRKADIAAGLKKVRTRLDHEIVVDWEWLEEKWAALQRG
jgi:hypothetical protein